MRYVDEFRSRTLIRKIGDRIRSETSQKQINIMEVCGTHTQAFFRFGLDKILPPNLKFIAGPGCPVCVSSQGYIDRALALATDKENLLFTFGDMLRVPGSRSSLEKERARYGNVVKVYSPLDALRLARLNPDKKCIFLAVGFETTAPTVAVAMKLTRKEKIKNLFFFSSLKLIPPVMGQLAGDRRLRLNGFLCPGHVSAIIGTKPYAFLAREYSLTCCIAGFEPLDILEGIYLILRQINRKKPAVINQYARAVSNRGNIKAQKVMAEVFKIEDACWRGLGIVPASGLKIRGEFRNLDAERVFSLAKKSPALNETQRGCRCGDILKGLISPEGCSLFARSCSPSHPVGPCMVSNEGACNAHYRFKNRS